MRGGGGFLLLTVGLVLLWLTVTGRLANAAAAWGALTGTAPGARGFDPSVPSGPGWQRIPGSVTTPPASASPPGPISSSGDLPRIPGTWTLG